MERPVYAYEIVDLPYEHVREVLARRPAAMFLPLQPTQGTPKIIVSLETDILDAHLNRDVEIVFGGFRDDGGDVCYRELTWSAKEAKGLFPKMNAEIEAVLLGHNRVQVSFIGSYRPPLGPVGDLGDSMGFHRAAEDTIRKLMARIAVSLVELGHEAPARNR